ncbi:conserved hypothetical protein [Xenorhabdus bovienii str. kraussei Becker Underwood]|uniref:Uncharacterized protein n=1 Tax=Xenorhabdus bovienii str. kraussei Becker Underwood TaxID=1398204 RepID=A0A077PXU9_XENBV|nr:conserved hypothetical protein [Xenorhabdus bovienii str. kraussei Becker Underwood]
MNDFLKRFGESVSCCLSSNDFLLIIYTNIIEKIIKNACIDRFVNERIKKTFFLLHRGPTLPKMRST